MDIKDTYHLLQMAYIFEFQSFTIRIQEQRQGMDLPSHQCKMIDVAKVRVNSGHKSKDASMVTFGVGEGNTLHVTTTFPGAPFDRLETIHGRVLGEGLRLTDSQKGYDVSKNDFSIQPVTYRSNSNNGVVVWAKGEAFGIFCKVLSSRDTVVEADNISFLPALCYRARNNISPEPANPLADTTAHNVQQYLLAVEETVIKRTDEILKSTLQLQNNMVLCDRRVEQMGLYFSDMEDLVKQQTNLILHKITERDTQKSTSTKIVNDLRGHMDRMLTVVTDSQTAITAVKKISTANAMSIKAAVDAINMNVCKLFQQQQRSYKTEEITLQPFNAKFSV